MTKLMILGASYLQLPLIKKAKDLGLVVGVVDYNPNSPGIPLADYYFNLSTNDQEGVFEVCKKFNPDGIVTMATDMPMRTIAYVSQKLGLTSIDYETALRATDKFEMIKCFEKYEVPHPKYQLIKKDQKPGKVLEYPFIIKPIDSSGSRGVSLVRNEDEFIECLEYSSINGRSGDVLLEEYLRGPEVSVEAIIHQNNINIIQITDKLTTGAPHFVEMGHCEPSNLDQKTKDMIIETAKKAIAAIGINEGAAHVEIIITKDGPKLVELGARLGGDNITSDLVPLSTGVDMVKAVIDIALGRKPEVIPTHNKGAAIKFLNLNQGEIENIRNHLENMDLDFKYKFEVTKINNEKVKSINNSTDRSAYILSEGKTAEDAIKNVNHLINLAKDET